MRVLILCAVLVFQAQAYAGPRVAQALTTSLNELVFTANLKDGFHFNEKAPNSLEVDGQSLKPEALSAREAKFSGLPAEFTSGKASLYICDDAVTFCETHVVEFKGKGKGKVKTVAAPAPKSPKGTINKSGFLEEDLNKALEWAKKQNKMVLIDFSARWCPGCARLEKEIFPTPAFKKIGKDFVKLKIDVDRFENSVLSEKFNIKGIPTLLVITTDQEEVDRLYDYQPIETIEAFFAAIKTDPAPLRELTEKAQGKDPEIQLRLGRRLLTAGRANEAVEYLKQINPPPPELLTAQVKANSKDVEVLKKAIQADPTSSRALAWRVQLAPLIQKADQKKKIREEGLKQADEMLANSERMKEAVKTDLVGEYTGFEPLMIATTRAELVDATGAPAEESAAAWSKAAQIGTDLKIPAKNTGASMRHLIVLVRAKKFIEADALARTLLKIEPNNYELHRRRLRALIELKKYDEAISVGKKVIKNSYGRNEFWAAEVVAKAYVQADRKKEAREFIDNYLKRAEINWPNMKDSRQAFEDLRKKVI